VSVEPTEPAEALPLAGLADSGLIEAACERLAGALDEVLVYVWFVTFDDSDTVWMSFGALAEQVLDQVRAVVDQGGVKRGEVVIEEPGSSHAFGWGWRR
jgi:hypothetical protein